MSANEKKKPIRPGTLAMSVLAAAIGVQKRKNLEQDFSSTSPIPFIIGGIAFTIIFISILVIVAKVALSA